MPYVRCYVIDPQGPSVYEREVSYDDSLESICGGPLEVIGIRASTDDSHGLELYVGDANLYHPEHWFELDDRRYIGTGVVMARNEAGKPVDIDVSVKWVQGRVKFPPF